jgi:ribosome maturation factor RimP
MTTADRLRELIDPIVADLGVDLFDLEFGGSQLRVTIDRPGGVDMEAVAATTRAISRMLDEADPIAGKFTLEVSSPGLERVLRTPEHYAWAVGQKVAVKTVPTFDGDRRVTGTIRRADDRVVVIATTDGEHEFGYDDIEKARTVFEWGGQPKPGSARSSENTRGGSSKNQTKTKRAKAS